jgi:hypothetical protein
MPLTGISGREAEPSSVVLHQQQGPAIRDTQGHHRIIGMSVLGYVVQSLLNNAE